MYRTKIFAAAATAALVVALTGLSGCGGGSTAPSSSDTSSEMPAAAADVDESHGPGDANSDKGFFGGAVDTTVIDGIGISGIAFEMVGDTPNFQIAFSNDSTDDIEFDLSKFKIVDADGNEVDFNLTSQMIPAHTPYITNTFKASSSAMKAGDRVTISYGGKDLGAYEVIEL